MHDFFHRLQIIDHIDEFVLERMGQGRYCDRKAVPHSSPAHVNFQDPSYSQECLTVSSQKTYLHGDQQKQPLSAAPEIQ